jgi:dihydrolipoamide dehydrogenase
MVVGEFTQETDLVVIGGGPAGYSAAFRAAELGVQTIIVDSREALGGVCLHEGCVPSKTLLHIAETINTAGSAAEFGVKFSKPRIDIAALRAWHDKTVNQLAKGLASLCKKHGVERLQGRAHFEDSRTIALLDSTIPRIRFRRALIATGSQPRAHPSIPFDGQRILTPGEALHLVEIPESLLIFGEDYMAVELATIFAALGSSVTLMCAGQRLLPEFDGDLVRPLTKTLEARLASLHTGEAPAQVEVSKSGVRAMLCSKPAKFDIAIITAGHIGNTRGLRLEKTKAQVSADEFAIIDSHLRTADPRVFAAGDVTGAPLLADKALHQGRIAAEVIAGQNNVYQPQAVPTTVFTDPQIAWCGIMEQEANAMGMPCGVAKAPWGASGRAVGMGRHDGLTKLTFDPASQLVLGVGLVGPHACEMISEAALAIEMGATLTDLADTIHPHPTVSELLSDAARQALAQPVP